MNKRLREFLRLKDQMRTSEEMIDEYDVYSERGILTLQEYDEINPAEEGFMLGYMATDINS